MKVKKLLCIILAVVLIAGVAAVPASAADPIDIKDAYTDTALPSEVVYGDPRVMFELLIDTPSAKMVELGRDVDYEIDIAKTTIDGKSITDEHDLYLGIAGKYHVVLKGIGNYTGTFILDVTLKKAPIDGTVYIEAGKGTIQAGTVLTAKYNGNADVEYRWFNNGMYIANATSDTYTVPTGAASGDKFTVKVTAKADDPHYTGSIESRPVVVGSTVLSGMVFINDKNGEAYGYGSLSGINEANVGDVLTAEFLNSDNLTSPTYDWVWYRGDEVIGNNNTYTVTTDDYSSTITLRAVGKGNFSGEVRSENYVWINSGEPSITLKAYSGFKSILAEWDVDTNGSEITEFTVQLREVGSSSPKTSVTKPKGAREHTFTGLENLVGYYVKVIATYYDSSYNSQEVSVESGMVTPMNTSVLRYAVDVENGSCDKVNNRAAEGETVKIEADAPTTDKVFDKWVVLKGGVTLADETSSTTTFTMPANAVKVKATYKDKNGGTVIPVTPVPTPSTPSTPSTPAHDCPSKNFKDVDISKWYHEYIDYVVENKLMNGVAADKFAPNATTTRAMIVTILYRLEGSPAVSGTNPFKDVKSGQWYTNAIIWAAENDIVNGYGDGKFGINDDITREQFAAIMYRYAKLKGHGFDGAWMFLLDFEDADKVSTWADEAMRWCVMNGIIEGVGGKTLDPQGNATRAQAAAMLMRFIEKVK